MNRDENLGRETALAPRVHSLEREAWVGPLERSSGGTWIATSAAGATLALLNAHPPHAVRATPDALVSRGVLIPTLITAPNCDEFGRRLSAMVSSSFRPFRLVAIFPGEHRLHLHKWDGLEMVAECRPWSMQQVFSSGISDEIATATRGTTTQLQPRREAEDENDWVRRLHCSHVPKAGAFSYCVHRADAKTVSYTEIAVEEDAITMRYHAGSPCECGERPLSGDVVRLARAVTTIKV